MIKKPSEHDIASLSVQEITDYLESLGWQQVLFSNKRLIKFAEPNDPEFTLVLPSDRRFGDYIQRVREVLEVLAQLAKVEPIHILQTIRNPYRDVMRLRIIKDDSLLSWEYAFSIVDSLRELLMYAASAQKSIHPFIRKPTNEGIEFLRSCKFGHTFEGSFGFTVESYIYDTPAFKGFEDLKEIPFQRQVMTRIATGIQQAKHAREEHDANLIVDNFESGLVANMCDALDNMFSVLRTPILEYGFEWSPQWKSSIPYKEAIRLEPNVVPYLKSASEKLKRKEDAPQNVHFIGHIVELKYRVMEDDPDDLERSRQVTIYGRDQNNRWRNVITHLAPPDYLQACNAHPHGNLVELFGVLEKGARHWYLRQVFNFKVLEVNSIFEIDTE